MKLLFFPRVLPVASVFVLSVVLVACHKSDNNMNNNTPVSGLMAFNLATDKAVTVTLSGNPITNLPLSFTSYTGNYLTIYSGSRLVQSFDYNSNNSLDSATYNFEPQKYYSLFVTGSNGHYKNVIVNDNFDSLSTSQAYIRYVNAINDPSSPAVTISANGINVINNNAPFASVSGFTAVTPGDVNIHVNNGGSINKSRTITLQQQHAYTVLLAGTPGSTGNDSLQIRYIENGTFSQRAQKTSSTVGSASSN
jgi:hypothetical protein